MEEPLGQILVARFADGRVAGVGRCFTYCAVPSVAIRTSDGNVIHWRHDMTEVVYKDGEIAEALIPLRGSGETRVRPTTDAELDAHVRADREQSTGEKDWE